VGIKEDLELNISEALKSIQVLDTALSASTKKFKAELTDATSVLNNVKVNFNTADLKKNIEDGAKSASVKVPVTIDSAQVKGQLDLFSQQMVNGKFEQLTIPFDDTPKQKIVDFGNEVENTANKASVNFAKVGTSAVQLGQTLTFGLTLPLAAAGVAAVNTGNEFEVAFARMVGLANVPAEEVERLRQGVLLLGGETTKSPNELAEALYFINSSGIAAADSLPILEQGAKAAAAGLGRTKDVVDVTTSVINAYGKENISAAQATDILVQAVRDGKGEPTAFAQVLGRVVPTAAKLGVEFDQVSAALAVMTRTGLSASEASISLNQVFNSFLNTTQEGEKVLEANGLSLSFIRDELAKPNGLINVMRLLDQTFGGNLETLDKVIPNIRALRGFLNVLAQDAESVDKVFANTNKQLQNTDETLGATAEAFDAFSQTTQADIDRAKVAVESALIRIGAVLAPFVTKAAGFVEGIVAMFDALSGGQQTALVVIGAVLAALGPLLIITGSLIRSVQTIISIGPQLLAVFTNPAFLTATVILGGLAAAFYFNAKAAAESKARVNDYTQAIREAGDVSAGVTKIIEGVFASGKNKDLLNALDAAGLKVKDLGDAVAAGGTRFEDFKLQLIAANSAANPTGIDALKTALEQVGSSYDEFKTKLAKGEDVGLLISKVSAVSLPASNAAISLREFAGNLDTVGKEVGKATENAEVLDRVLGKTDSTAEAAAVSLGTLPPELQAIVDSAQNATVSAEVLTAALDTLNKATPSFTQRFADGAASIIKNTGGATNALKSLTEANKATEKASGGAAKAVESEAEAMEKAEQRTQKYEDSIVAVEKAQRKLLEAQQALTEAQQGPSEIDQQKAQLQFRDAARAQEDAVDKLAEAKKKLDDLQGKNNGGFGAAPLVGDAKEIAKAQREVDEANDAVLKTQISLKEIGDKISEQQNFNVNTDAKVVKAKEDVKDAETNLQKTLRESKDAYDAITLAVDKVTTAQGGNASAIKEKYIPTIEEFTGKLQSNFTDQLNFFTNIQTLVDRGATNLAKSIVELGATDKQAASELAGQAVKLTDDRLAEQERLITETEAKNAALVEAQKKLYEDLIRTTGEKKQPFKEAVVDLFDIPDDELIAASGQSAGQAFIDGLIKGIGAHAAEAADAARDGMNNAIKAARDAAGIKSPSTVMAKVGENMVAGLRLGLLAEQQKAVAAAEGLVQGVVSAASAADRSLVPVGGALAGLLQPSAPTTSQTTNEFNFDIQIDSVTAQDAEQVGAAAGDSAARAFLARRNSVSLRTGGGS
jgi:TP901 family phage tail tape measure protein